MPQLPLPRIAALGALLFCLLSQVVLAEDRFTRQVNFDIAAQTVESALIEFSKQADVQVMVGTLSLSGQKTDGVKGKLSVTSAIEQLLKNTGLEYQAKGNTITVRSIKNARADGQVRPLVPDVRLAGNGAAQEAARSGRRVGEDASVGPNPETLAEVVVTGTHIRGREATGPVLSFTATDIAETGYATTQDWLDTLPQNFAVTQNEEGGGRGNFNRGTGINLRGLGAGATLVLVNGRRQPASGLEGDFVDISSLPASAIARVEVLTDGASAIYGSDAIGGVVNFVLRSDFSGAETSARYSSADGDADETAVSQLFGVAWDGGHAMLDYQYYEREPLGISARDFSASADKRQFGGTDFRITNGNPANILVGGLPAYAIPPNQDGTNLAPSDLLPGVVNLQEPLTGTSLLPKRKMHSAFLAASQELGDRTELFLEGRFNKRDIAYDLASLSQTLPIPASNPFFVSPNGAPVVIVAYNFFDDYGTRQGEGETETYFATLGGSVRLGADWRSEISLSSGSEKLDFTLETLDFTRLFSLLGNPDPAVAFNPFGDGSHTSAATLDSLRAVQREKGKSDIRSANLITDGPLFHMPGGSAKLAFGADYRTEELERGTTRVSNFDRDVTAAFAELVLPIFGPENATAGAHALELSAAGRYEEYSDFGSTFNPNLGIRFKPWRAVSLLASWGTSFKAPPLVDLDEVSFPPNVAAPSSLPDPRAVSGRSSALLISGGNSDLQEETADTWTAGLELQLLDNLTTTLTYYSIDYSDRIGVPGPLQTERVLFQEDLWSSIITRNPSRAQIDAVCNSPTFIGSRPACLASTPAVIVDQRKRNIAETSVEGIDLVLDHRTSTRLGDFGLRLNGAYILNYDVMVTAGAPATDVRDTINNPVSLRLRATGTWSYRNWGISLALNHTDGYDDNVSGLRVVDAWDTVDLRVAYRTAKGGGLLGGLELALSAANVLDEDPPFANNLFGYDPANANPLGRVVGFALTKSW